jgi:hypothetical protein
MERSLSTRALRTMVWVCSAFVFCTPQPPPPGIAIDSPASGAFVNAASVLVTGHVSNVSAAAATGQVTVNGTIVPVNPDLSFSATVALDASKVFNPVVATLFPAQPNPPRSRVTVIAGPSVLETDLASQSVALRLNDSGLDEIEPVITSLVPLDLASLLPIGTVVINDYCYASLFGACIGRADAIIESPAPAIGSYGIAVDSMTNQAAADVTLNNLAVHAKVTNASGIAFTCHLTVTANVAHILGSYALEPDPSNPSNVDVNQLGDVAVNFTGFDSSNNCDGILGDVVEFFIDLFVGNFETLVRNGLISFLADPPGPADAPIADAVEQALAGISIAGPIGAGIGVTLEAPLFEVAEDPDGITLGAHSRMTVVSPNPNAANPTASLVVPSTFPSYGPLTPSSQAYGLAIGVSPTAFNQLLRTQIEGGLLLSDLTELDLFGTGPIPITASLLALFEPKFGSLGAQPITLKLRPHLAPVITGIAGPAGELTDLRVGELAVDVVLPLTNTVLVRFLVDAKTGLGLGFDAGSNSLTFALSPVQSSDISVEIVDDQLKVNEDNLKLVLPQLFAAVFPSIASELASFPLPQFFGLNLHLVEIGKQQGFLSLYLDLAP